MSQPLILTLQIDDQAQVFYDGLRRRYFPPERNFIDAHVTLFHHLPDEDRTYDIIRERAERTPIFRLAKPTVRSIGRGVAVFFDSEQPGTLHAALSGAFPGVLIAQDRQHLRPHIVVQNKVDAETARRSLEALRTQPLVEPRAIGMTLWRYLGGPWERLRDLSFDAKESNTCRG